MASYLDARHHQGRWLLRIDDIDPPREVPGAADAIQRDLDLMALHWDGPVLLQSSRREAYAAAASGLLARGDAYRCRCSRRDVRTVQLVRGSVRYPGTCRGAQIPDTEESAVRIMVRPRRIQFVDRVQGPQSHVPAETGGDFVIHRRDGLPAYNLATAVDEAHLGVTHVVRGVDLLETTPSQIYLQQALGLPSPQYGHVPIIVNARGQKLSKQAGARRAAMDQPGAVAFDLLGRLGLSPPADAYGAPPDELWRWAVPLWRLDRIADRRQISE